MVTQKYDEAHKEKTKTAATRIPTYLPSPYYAQKHIGKDKIFPLISQCSVLSFLFRPSSGQLTPMFFHFSFNFKLFWGDLSFFSPQVSISWRLLSSPQQV